MAGMKRKAQSAPASPVNKREEKASRKADASRKTKKAKVEEPVAKVVDKASKAKPKAEKVKKVELTPTEEALKVLVDALNGPVGDVLDRDVVMCTTDILSDALTAPIEDRSALQTKYIALVEETFNTATKALELKAAEAATELLEVQETNTETIAAVDTAKATLTTCEETTAAAKEAAVQAESVKDASDSALDSQKDEMSNMEKTKEKNEKISADFAATLELIKSPESTAKDGKKVCATLKSISASDSMLNSITPALGNWNVEGFEAMILQQAAKVVQAKADEVNAILGDWEAHCGRMQGVLDRLEAELATNTATLEACKEAITVAVAAQKEATAGVKEAEATQKKQQKKADTSAKDKEEADGVVTDANATLEAFKFLELRTEIVSFEEVPEEEVVADVEMAAADVEMAAPSPVKSPVKSPTPVKGKSPTPVKGKSPTPVKQKSPSPVKQPTPVRATPAAYEPTPAKTSNGLVFDYGSPTPAKAMAEQNFNQHGA